MAGIEGVVKVQPSGIWARRGDHDWRADDKDSDEEDGELSIPVEVARSQAEMERQQEAETSKAERINN